MLCFAAAILGDSTAEALLLAHFDAGYVPKMFLVNAVLLFFASAFMISIIDRIDRGILFVSCIFGHASVLLLIRLSVLVHLDFLYLPLFSYAYLTKIILFLIFWTLANDLIDSRRAGKQFPVIAAGGTLGAIVVSFSIPGLMKIIAAENLVLLWSFLTFVLGFCLLPVQKKFGRQFRTPPDSRKKTVRNLAAIKEDCLVIAREPLLLNMSVLYFIVFFLLLNQQYLFYRQLRAQFSSAEPIASFLGLFTGASMFTTLILQLTFAGKIIRKIGSTRSMLFLPCALLVAFTSLFAVNVLSPSAAMLFWAVVGGMGLRVAFFDSFFSPNFQVFFSSLPQEIRGRGKLSIEGVVKPVAMVLAGIWMLAFVPVIPLWLNVFVLFILAVAAILQTLRLRASYTRSLAHYLTGFYHKNTLIGLTDADLTSEGSSLGALEAMLKKDIFEIRQFAVDVLANAGTTEAVALLREHAEDPDARMRATVIAALGALVRGNLRDIFSRSLVDKDYRVVANSILALARYRDPEIVECIEPFLSHPDTRIRANTILSLWPFVPHDEKLRLLNKIREMLDSAESRECASALFVLGEIEGAGSLETIQWFFDRSKERIISQPEIWFRFRDTLSKKCDFRSVDIILDLSSRAANPRKRECAAVIGKLIAKGLGCPAILDRARAGSLSQRSILIHAVHSSAPALSKEDEQVLRAIADQEIRAIEQERSRALLLEPWKNLDCIRLLSYAVEEEAVDERLSILIHIASLLDPAGRIRVVINRLHHANTHIRARAFEVLDNTGDIRLNRAIISFLDKKKAVQMVNAEKADLYSAITDLNGHCNGWISLCASYAASMLYASTGDERYRSLRQVETAFP